MSTIAVQTYGVRHNHIIAQSTCTTINDTDVLGEATLQLEVAGLLDALYASEFSSPG